jgi:hypothetical protein
MRVFNYPKLSKNYPLIRQIRQNGIFDFHIISINAIYFQKYFAVI